MDRLNWKNWSLAVRLVLVTTFLIVVSVIATSTLAIRRINTSFQAELQIQAELLLTTLETSSKDALYYLDVDKITDIIQLLGRKELILTYGRVFDSDGRILADAYDEGLSFGDQIDPFGKQLLESDSIVFEWQEDQLLAGKAVIAGSQRFGAIAIGLPTAPLITKVNTLRFQGIVTALVTSIAGILLALLFGRTITQPLQELTEMAQNLTTGDSTQRVPIRQNDELSLLAKTFNTMADKLQSTLKIREQRAQQLKIIANVTYSISALQNPDTLLSDITNLVGEYFDFYHVGIFLLDDSRQFALLRAANSKGGQKMLADNYRLHIKQHGIIGYTILQDRPRIALDVGKEAVFFDSPQLPETHSEVVLPLKLDQEVIGALDIQSEKTNAFSQEDIAVFATLANQISVAIQNTQSLAQTQHALRELDLATSQLTIQAWQASNQITAVRGYHFEENSSYPLEGAKKIYREGALRIPIQIRGHEIASLILDASHPKDQWSNEDIAMAQAVAERTGFALENARLLEEAQRHAAREHMVSEITTKIRETNDPQVMIQTALDELKEALGASKIELATEETKDR